MITLRSISTERLDDWLGLSPAGPDTDRLTARLHDAWADGSGGPALTFLAVDAGRPIGRLAWVVNPVGTVMPDALEAVVTGLWLADDPAIDAVEVGRRLIVDTAASLPPGTIAIDGWTNPASMAVPELRRSVFEAAGLRLLQEKEGFLWRSGGVSADRPAPGRLRFRSVDDAGGEAIREALSRAVVGTLDRQDAYYRDLVGPEAWGREMLGFLEPGDRPGWLLAEADGETAGYVLLGAFDGPARATIVHIGVVPEARGRGYVDELLRAANATAERLGFDRILSDVDVLNPPMLAAMQRNGHDAAATPWHVWHHRLELA